VLGFCGSAMTDNDAGHGDSGAGGGMPLYEEAKVGEAVDDGCISAGSGVEGRKDRGGQAGFGDDDGDDDRSV
jgi:hypothetical protein